MSALLDLPPEEMRRHLLPRRDPPKWRVGALVRFLSGSTAHIIAEFHPGPPGGWGTWETGCGKLLEDGDRPGRPQDPLCRRCVRELGEDAW